MRSMARRWRVWRALRWALTFFCAAVLAVGVFSFFLRPSVTFRYGYVAIANATLCIVVCSNGPVYSIEFGFGPDWLTQAPDFEFWLPRVYPSQAPRVASGRWTPTGRVIRLPPPRIDWVTVLPFWFLLAIGLPPTIYLWLRPTTFPHDRCRRCGYDLTGNVSGVCPECGAKLPASAAGAGARSG